MTSFTTSGYESIKDFSFVPDDEAFDYALERIQNDENEKKEFVDWFFSGNWVRREKVEQRSICYRLITN